MSDSINDVWLERAQVVRDYFEGTDLEIALNNAVEKSDLEMLQALVTEAEAEISRQEFFNNDSMVGANDTF